MQLSAVSFQFLRAPVGRLSFVFQVRAILIRIMNLTSIPKLLSSPADRAALARLRCGCLWPQAQKSSSTIRRRRRRPTIWCANAARRTAARCKAIYRPPAAQQLVASAIAAFGRLDILVANHGIWPPEDAPIDRMSDEQWHRTIAVNVDSVSDWSSIRRSNEEAADDGAGRGHIVLVSSTPAARRSLPL